MNSIILISQRDAYRIMFKDYPDVLNIDEMCGILWISTKTGYQLLKDENPESQSRSYRIPKIHLMTYLGIGENL